VDFLIPMESGQQEMYFSQNGHCDYGMEVEFLVVDVESTVV